MRRRICTAIVGVAAVPGEARTLTACRTLGALLAIATLRALTALCPLTALGPVVAIVARLAFTARLPVFTILAVAPRLAVVAILPIIPILPVVAIILLIVGCVEHLLVAILVVEIVVARAALVLEPRTALAEHAEIVIGILEVIFGLHAVAGELCIARHALVLLKELGGVATLAIVLPISRLTAEILTSLASTTAPAAVLTIIDQMPTSLRSV
ncbi:hypothetical protein ACUXST_001739 [Sphingomonas sp. F9_3S_D5_B_2]